MDEVKKLQNVIEDLTRRIERHEWRIQDLEKRLVPPADTLESDQKEGEFREPILKKAAVSSSSKNKNKQTNYLGWLIVLAIMSAGIGYVAMSYMG